MYNIEMIKDLPGFLGIKRILKYIEEYSLQDCVKCLEFKEFPGFPPPGKNNKAFA